MDESWAWTVYDLKRTNTYVMWHMLVALCRDASLDFWIMLHLDCGQTFTKPKEKNLEGLGPWQHRRNEPLPPCQRIINTAGWLKVILATWHVPALQQCQQIQGQCCQPWNPQSAHLQFDFSVAQDSTKNDLIMKSIHKCLHRAFHCYIGSFKRDQKRQKHPFEDTHPCQAAEKGWHDFAGSEILSNWRCRLEAQVTSWHLCFDFCPEVQQISQKQSPFLIGESLDGFLSPRRHHTSESSQTRRPRPLRRSKWAKCSPSLRSSLKIWPKILQKSWWKKWASESTPKNDV